MKSVKVNGGTLAPEMGRGANLISSDALISWLPVLAALFVHYKVLFNGFLFDDFMHLFIATDSPFNEAIIHSGTQHLLYSYKLAIWLINSFFGANPFVFLLLGLIVHLASVRLLYEIIFCLTRNVGMGAFGASLWGMSPQAAGSLGWISVHGQVYAAAAILWVLLDIVRSGETRVAISNGALLRHAFLLFIAATSFGTGLAAAVVIPIVALLWQSHSSRRLRSVAIYGLVSLVIVVLYWYSGARTDSVDPISKISAAGAEGILRSLDALTDLFSVGFSGLVMGPFLVGKLSLVQQDALIPVSKLIALLVAVPLLLLGLLVSDTEGRRGIVGLLAVPCAIYGLIAFARSNSLLPFSAETLRYHYLPPAIFAILICFTVARLLDGVSVRISRVGRPMFIAWLMLVIVPYYLGSEPALKKFLVDSQVAQYRNAMRKIESAIRNNTGQSEIYIANDPFKVFPWKYTPKHFPGLAGLFIISYPGNVVDGKRIFFVEESTEMVEFYQARKGSRIAELLVNAPVLSPDDDTPGPGMPTPQQRRVRR